MSEPFGAIEAGGTKFICAVGTGPEEIVAEERFPTEDPETTFAKTIAFFESQPATTAIGVASFGPVELRYDHPQYGSVTTTPKPGWSNTPIVGPIAQALGVPVGFDTDVNGAALGEGRWGAARELRTFVYVTVGTGIGAGAVVNGRVAHGLVHSEMGHISIASRPDDTFAGVCPFHGDCFEGMAAGPAIEARWGLPAHALTGDDLTEAVATEAFSIAQGLRNIVYALAPERIVLGGGVAKMPGIFPATRSELAAALAGYPGLPEHRMDDFVVPPGLGDRAGIAGGFVLAELASMPNL